MNLYIFSDCHVDGVSAVMTRDEYTDKVIAALNTAKTTGGIVVMLGDNEDIKNSRDPDSTTRLHDTIKNLVHQYGFVYCHGNHDDVDWIENNQFDIARFPDGRVLFAQHGYTAKYGFNTSGKFSPGANWFMRSLKCIGVLYRWVFPWKLTEKKASYIAKYQKEILPGAGICLSGHVHPKKVYTFWAGKTLHIVCPQGYTELEV